MDVLENQSIQENCSCTLFYGPMKWFPSNKTEILENQSMRENYSFALFSSTLKSAAKTAIKNFHDLIVTFSLKVLLLICFAAVQHTNRVHLYWLTDIYDMCPPFIHQRMVNLWKMLFKTITNRKRGRKWLNKKNIQKGFGWGSVQKKNNKCRFTTVVTPTKCNQCGVSPSREIQPYHLDHSLSHRLLLPLSFTL